LETKHKKISVIVPAYNEEKSITACIKEIKNAMKESCKDYEIVVVDDGSTDQTYLNLVNSFKKDPHIKISSYKPNIGKGYAITRGFGICTGDLIAFIDADMDLHPSHILLLMDYMDLKDADVVIGSKRHPDSTLFYPWIRKLYSYIYYILIKIFFGLPIKDTQTGVKLFKKDVLKNIIPNLKTNKYAFDLELLVLAHKYGYKIAEAPIKLTFGRKYAGRIRSRDIFNILKDTILIFCRLNFRKEKINKN
jgi:glycosyltransferase involved in cell wall biosynthesis